MPFAIRLFDHTETLGGKLRAMRRHQHLSLDRMVKKTKIQKQYLTAFETGAYHLLPEPIYAKNFLRMYVHALGGDVDYFLEQFACERGTCDLVDPLRLPRQKVRARTFLAAHRLYKFGLALILCLALATYVGYNIHELLRPPEIMVFEPTDEWSTAEAVVVVRGKTDVGIEIFVNGEKMLQKTDGTFETTVALERGLNLITIEGATRHSRKTVLYRRVVLEQEKPHQLGALSTSIE
jgi:transcriptional regulator with XRE-family HTH domain